MTCYQPSSIKRKNSKRGRICFPCGHCTGCRLEKSRQWAMRCMHEASMHKESCFVTLTYNEGNLPYGDQEIPTLNPIDIEKFWKRLRREYGNGIKYYACGEYGERTNRPHYHACIFGVDFQDKKLCSLTERGDKTYTSDILDTIWGLGNCVIGDVTFESAAYVARYVMKKQLGKKAEMYKRLGIVPEFARMSRRPGIGAGWYDKYQKEVYPFGFVRARGNKSKPPRYYQKLLERVNPLEAEIQSKRRQFEAEKKYWHSQDVGAPKLSAQERVKKSQIKSLKRSLD